MAKKTAAQSAPKTPAIDKLKLSVTSNEVSKENEISLQTITEFPDNKQHLAIHRNWSHFQLPVEQVPYLIKKLNDYVKASKK
jgi:hypothetical protein